MLQLKGILGVSEWSEALDMCHNSKETVISKLLSHYDVSSIATIIFITFLATFVTS